MFWSLQSFRILRRATTATIKQKKSHNKRRFAAKQKIPNN